MAAPGYTRQSKAQSTDALPADERLNEGAPTKQSRRWSRRVPVQTLYSDYVRTSEVTGVRRRSGETTFGISMRKAIPGLGKKRVSTDLEEFPEDDGFEIADRRACYELPSLEDCRAAFERKLGQPVNWDVPVCDSDGTCGSAVEKGEGDT